MKRVARLRRARPRRPWSPAAATSATTWAPRKLCIAGRGRSVGRSSTSGAAGEMPLPERELLRGPPPLRATPAARRRNRRTVAAGRARPAAVRPRRRRRAGRGRGRGPRSTSRPPRVVHGDQEPVVALVQLDQIALEQRSALDIDVRSGRAPPRRVPPRDPGPPGGSARRSIRGKIDDGVEERELRPAVAPRERRPAAPRGGAPPPPATAAGPGGRADPRARAGEGS